ncbi:DUF222 domain-containing protein, partial [Microbispora sp. H10836]|uniref:HNH endonuclease signature motif containing protein n=1 Tax=Microbispora sp. H10836 TaxID=2729106 RepID=UPI0028937935
MREKFAVGGLAAGVVEAICTAVAGLSDEQAALAEPILLELAGKAGAAEVARAGRYLRAVLDPDGEDRDERADYGRRFLRVRRGKGGGLEGEFYLPREHAARLQALLDAYARPKAEGDDRPLRVRQADAFMALLEERIAAELLVLVNAESLPTDPTPDHPQTPERPETPIDTEEPEDTPDTETVRQARHTEDAQVSRDSEDISVPAEDGATDVGSTGPVDTVDQADLADLAGAGDAEEAVSGVGAAADVAAEATVENAGQSAVEGAEPATGPRGVEPGDDAIGRAQAKSTQRSESQQEPQQSTPQQSSSPKRQESRSWESHGGGACGCGSRARCSSTAPETPGTPEASGARVPEPGAPSARGAEPGSPRGVLGPEPERPPGASAGGLPGALLGTALGMAPGLLLATGEVLPVSGVHRLARTSTLVRLVMDAEGQVLDMGRKVRLATPAQRRAIYARYATCWIDGCPLPATRCQIDHADNWSTGGLTDLKLLGPACQFHNRDRYQHPDR